MCRACHEVIHIGRTALMGREREAQEHFCRVNEEYGTEGLTACPMLREGQVFYADYAKPEGLCDEAWKAIYQYVFALAHGSGKELFYYGDWIRTPGVAICSCNDGLRPVIFKLEATDIDSEIDYTPVQ